MTSAKSFTLPPSMRGARKRLKEKASRPTRETVKVQSQGRAGEL